MQQQSHILLASFAQLDHCESSRRGHPSSPLRLLSLSFHTIVRAKCFALFAATLASIRGSGSVQTLL